MNIIYPDGRKTTCLHRFYLDPTLPKMIFIVCTNPLVYSLYKVENVQNKHSGEIQAPLKIQLSSSRRIQSSPVSLIAASISNLTRLHRGFLSPQPAIPSQSDLLLPSHTAPSRPQIAPITA